MPTRTDLPRIAILGAGPIGLEAALYAACLPLSFSVYERGRVSEHIHQWGHVRLFSPFGMNSTPLGRARIREDNPGLELPGDGALLTGREHIAAYLGPLAASPLLRDSLQTETAVLHIGRKGLLKEDNPGDGRRSQQPFRLLLRARKGERVEEADVILDCTGTYGQPRFLGDGGIPAVGELAARPQIVGGLDDILGERANHYADRTTLVIGAGCSAATTVCNLAALAEKHPATWVIWLARGAATQPIRRAVNDPLRERDLLAVRANNLATRCDGNVEFHPQCAVQAVECAGPDKGFKVTARCCGTLFTWDVDRVIANVGYSPHPELNRELHLRETVGHANLADGLRQPEPNYYLLGSKSHGRNSQFLLRAGFEQVREVFALITGKSGLDLYKKR
jgi:thioredoxin reductase